MKPLVCRVPIGLMTCALLTFKTKDRDNMAQKKESDASDTTLPAGFVFDAYFYSQRSTILCMGKAHL